MKKNWLAIALTMVTLALTACNSNDDEVIGEIAPVAGEDFLFQGVYPSPVETSDPLTLFMREELCSPFLHNDGQVYETFFKSDESYEEKVIVINNKLEFHNAYMGTKKLPDVDFSRYTLVLGRTWGNDGSYRLDQTILWSKGLHYELEFRLSHLIDVVTTLNIQVFYYWRLYPKLKHKPFVPKRTVKSIEVKSDDL